MTDETIKVLEHIKKEINEYANSKLLTKEDTYPYVDIEVVEQIINKHIEDIERK